jgi:hypothetical protein
MSETSAHLSLVDFLDRTALRLPDLAFVFHVANESAGGAKSKSGVPLDILKEARMGCRAGVWDFMLIRPTGGVAIELKSDAAYKKRDEGLSPAQVAWRAHYEACGWDCYVFPESRWHEAALLLVAYAGGDPSDYQFS